jgi:CspA family cold shock protein
MKNGKVKFYNEEKGYGFITDDKSGEELFFHASGVNGGNVLKQGDKITYESGNGKKGANGKGHK